MNGGDLRFGNNLRSRMEIALKERVTFRLCGSHLGQRFDFLCQKDSLLIAKHLIYLLPVGRIRGPKIHLNVVCNLDQLTFVVMWRKVIQSQAKTRAFEVFACFHKFCVSGDVSKISSTTVRLGSNFTLMLTSASRVQLMKRFVAGGAGNHR